MHSVEARRTLDPVTGKEALLVCSRDVEERVVNEQRLERSRAQLAAQAEELERLAAPVLRVGSGVLVLPLIGRVDGARMEMALAALLPRIASDRARAVIFDLTGAMFVDAETADSLRRALGTLRLLGCGAVVAGVLPGLARLLVEADARLGARAYQSVEDALRGLSRE
jgi:rsbT co-antagonist protein RsbR